jgi:G3E family GTPase
MQKIRLILVGGFLGAGKTTLLAQAAGRLAGQGKRVGVITNDQAAGLVDTEIARQVSERVQEVSGGCFCCRFGEFISSLKRLLADFTPDVVLAEPVGSCTDLSATVLQPLKKLYSEIIALAPFSVLVDPVRLREALSADGTSLFPDSVNYVFRKQMEEADLIVLNKIDLLSQEEASELRAMIDEHFPERPLLTMSALDDREVGTWLEFVTGGRSAGQWIAEVDYDTYARGEAELGWLNAEIRLRAERPVDWKGFCLDLLGMMRDEFRARPAEIAHLKIFLEGSQGTLTGSLTRLSAEPGIRGEIHGGGTPVRLLVNARVHLDPGELRAVVERCLRSAAGDDIATDISSIRSFRPGRPEPTHRFDRVV